MTTDSNNIRRTQGWSVAQTRQEAQQHETCDRSELNDLLCRSDGFSEEELRLMLCSAFLLGNIDADGLYQSLKENGLILPQESFMRAYAVGVLALAAERDKADPERSSRVRVTTVAKEEVA